MPPMDGMSGKEDEYGFVEYMSDIIHQATERHDASGRPMSSLPPDYDDPDYDGPRPDPEPCPLCSVQCENVFHHYNETHLHCFACGESFKASESEGRRRLFKHYQGNPTHDIPFACWRCDKKHRNQADFLIYHLAEDLGGGCHEGSPSSEDSGLSDGGNDEEEEEEEEEDGEKDNPDFMRWLKAATNKAFDDADADEEEKARRGDHFDPDQDRSRDNRCPICFVRCEGVFLHYQEAHIHCYACGKQFHGKELYPRRRLFEHHEEHPEHDVVFACWKCDKIHQNQLDFFAFHLAESVGARRPAPPPPRPPPPQPSQPGLFGSVPRGANPSGSNSYDLSRPTCPVCIAQAPNLFGYTQYGHVRCSKCGQEWVRGSSNGREHVPIPRDSPFFCIKCEKVHESLGDSFIIHLGAAYRHSESDSFTHHLGQALGKVQVSAASSKAGVEVAPTIFPPPPTEVVFQPSTASWNGRTFECYLCHEEFRTLALLTAHVTNPLPHQYFQPLGRKCPEPTCNVWNDRLHDWWKHIDEGTCGVQRFSRKEDAMAEEDIRTRTSFSGFQPAGVQPPGINPMSNWVFNPALPSGMPSFGRPTGRIIRDYRGTPGTTDAGHEDETPFPDAGAPVERMPDTCPVCLRPGQQLYLRHEDIWPECEGCGNIFFGPERPYAPR
ncbi:hypothetical protein BKA70DRAFT_1485117 [Coprinopsis sp. MPI-PUGE-AT-0042]|nr:hypothetical protein BKA70DRAFT_1485117 [Coprinopsis sp. MPI-PUGE-AT-0042]